MGQKIPATVITGFLGAGKTTLVRGLLARANGRRIALIVNEFGDVGVDGETLSDCGDEACKAEDIVELANGCLCCTVAADFIPTMEQLLAREPAPDHIVIETSGLALPQPLVQAFNWPEVRARVTVDGVVTVVDARAVADGRFAPDEAAIAAQRAADDSLDHDSPLHELFEDQLACADMVVLSKTDLMNEGEVSAVSDLVGREMRTRARMVRAVSGDLPADLVIGLDVAAENDLADRHGHHGGDDHEPHDHDDFDSFVVPLSPVADADSLVHRLNDVANAHDVLRMKGFAAVDGKPMRLVVQAVGPRTETYYDRPWQDGETRDGHLVVIGLKGLEREAIARAIAGADG